MDTPHNIVWTLPDVSVVRARLDRQIARTTPDIQRQSPVQRVWASPDAIDAIIHLRAALGVLCFRLEDGAVGDAAVRLVRASPPAGLNDVHLGTIAGASLFADWDKYEAWGHPEFRVAISGPDLSDHAEGVTARYLLVAERGGRGGTLEVKKRRLEVRVGARRSPFSERRLRGTAGP